MHTGHSDAPCNCKAGCGSIVSERNRYFTGKYMTARDFQADQDYFLSHHRLHNRLLHGWGIVCGLAVVHHPNPDCASRWVIVRPGIALDCCGRELVLQKDYFFELPFPKAPPTPPRGFREIEEVEIYEAPGVEFIEEIDVIESEAEPVPEAFLLCLRYVEDEIETVPALYAEGRCDPKRLEANRLRENVKLEILRADGLPGNCWQLPGRAQSIECRDDCDEVLPGPVGTCLDPVCPCGGVVPLALITLMPRAEPPFEIDLDGRKKLPTPPELLTHIVQINWPHGGIVSLEELREMRGQLKIRFDRKLRPASDNDATGINQSTLMAQYTGDQRTLQFVPSADVPTLEEECVAVFSIDPDYLKVSGRRGQPNLADNTVYVTLRCDFIMDCHDNPVDGNYLRGRLPSGNGVPGGVFESWFRVVE